MLGEVLGIALAGDDVAEDSQAGDTGDVADYQRQLHVHLDQRFLHALHEGTRALDQRGPVPKIPPQRDDAVGGAEAAAQESQDVEVAEPFTVGDIALPAGKIFDMAGIDQDHSKPSVSEDSRRWESPSRRPWLPSLRASPGRPAASRQAGGGRR